MRTNIDQILAEGQGGPLLSVLFATSSMSGASAMYDLIMASIIKKRIRGRTYYYARECKRVDGKPKIVWQKYLGSADKLISSVTLPAEPPAPTEAVVREFGAVVALYDLAKRLRIVECIDECVPKRGRGPSVGTYLLIATINRCVAPCSKAAMGEWFQDTVLRRLLDIDPGQLSSQRFWENMDRVPRLAVEAIERDLTSHLVREFEIDLKRVLFDATNFFTYIDTFNDRCTIAQRGKSKQERDSLRIVGLALLVSADFHVPLLHRTFPGNQTDAPTFASLTDKLVARYRQLVKGAEHVTLVLDKGNNSHDNLDAIADGPYHFIGSLVPTQHPDLLAIPKRRFRSLEQDGMPTVSVYRTEKEVFGVTRTVLVTYNDKFFDAQSKTLLREIAKRQRRLRELQAQLRRHRVGAIRGRRPTIASVQRKVDSWLKARHMKELFHVEITEQDGLPALEYRFKRHAWQKLQKRLLGKTIIFTDNDDWADADIVKGYRSQHHIETAFRTMKDPHHISLRPQHHWTNQKIEVHVFYCVLALMLCSVLRRELHRRGIHLSIARILDQLGKIREIGLLYPAHGGAVSPTLKMTISAMNDEQRSLYQALDLGRYRAG